MAEEVLIALTIGLFFLLVSLAGMSLAWRRRVEGPHPWTSLDACLGLVTFVSVSSTFLLFSQAILGGEEPGFGFIMLSTVLGAMGSLVVVFLRASTEKLGLKRLPWTWMLIGCGMVVPFMAFTWGWVSLMELFVGEIDEQAIVETVRDGDEFMKLQGLLYGVLVAPIAEEILFRGFLLGAIERARGAAVAVVVSGLVFGLFHISDPITLVPLSVMGVCLGWLRIRSDSLWPAWAMHVGNNGTVMVLVMLAEA